MTPTLAKHVRPLPWPPNTPTPDSVEAFYARAMKYDDGHVGPHLPRLRALASGLPLVVEFGVRRGGSSSALILGAEHVISYDIESTAEAKHLQALAGDKWEYRIANSLEVAIPECDLLFIDSKHTFLHCDAELKRHAHAAKRWLVFHDSIWRGSMGEGTNDMKLTRQKDETARLKCLGLRPAVDDLMMRDRSWFLSAHYTDSCGLLVLERRVA